MKIIKKFEQFNESNSESGLDPHQEEHIKNLVNSNIKSLNNQQIGLISEELEKISNKMNCKVKDLANVDFVKNNLLRIAYNYLILGENFITDMKDKILVFILNFFQMGGVVYGIIKIVVSAIAASFWGVLFGAIAIAISTLAVQYLYNKFAENV